MRFSSIWRPLTLIAVLVSATAFAADKSGVDPARVKLPKGPGSLEGIGENAEPSINMGSVSYGVPLALPAGYQGHSPKLSPRYNSTGGNSEVGLGWSLGVMSIERSTAKGLPKYDSSDTFAVGGSDELVRLPQTNIYRARFEGGFVRYRFVDAAGLAKEGYWVAEFPDGKVGTFGATADGTLVPNARASGPNGTFAYYLVEMVDVYGHAVRYSYRKAGNRPLLAEIGWVYAGTTPRYRIALGYEPRADTDPGDTLSDGKPGFEMRLAERVHDIAVYVRGTLLRRYQLSYEPYAISGGLTRLARVITIGSDDTSQYPVAFSFEYSDALGAMCAGSGCAVPSVTAMGSLGVDFRTGQADLVDLNGDSLPDVMDTSTGQHRIHLNRLSANAGQSFGVAQASQTVTNSLAHLDAPRVQPVDFNGDGYTDLVDGTNQRVLYNFGDGDWHPTEILTNGLPDFSANANLRFFDYDLDKKPDIIDASHSTTAYYLNRGDGTFASVALVGDAIGWGIADDGLRLADMNGDGMQDAILALPGSVAYRSYLGRGTWAGTEEMFGVPIDWAPNEIQWVDINGDGLTDAVVVRALSVSYALNRNGDEFDAAYEVKGADVVGDPMPEKTGEVSLRFADMNGSGSIDVVWINASGKLSYLELFPERPNLLTRVDNGIGKVIEVQYGTAVSHMVRDGGIEAWSDRLPHPMLTLDTLETYDTLSGVRQTQEFLYHNGYFDGVERQFRGFANVEVRTTGDASIESGEVRYTFDVGKGDPYRKGLLLTQATLSGDEPLSASENSFEDCLVAEVPQNIEPAVRYVCQTRTVQTLQERQPESAWVTLESASSYDAYGNVLLAQKLGVTSVGGGACEPCTATGTYGEPCGTSCLGDEAFSETLYVPPTATSGRWLIHLPYSAKSYGREGSDTYKEQRTYYDGEAHVGLPLGQATHGQPTRISLRRDAASNPFVDSSRQRFDAHGNVLETWDANTHKRRFGYDADGLLVTSEEVLFDAAERETKYALVREAAYHPLYEQVTDASAWMLAQGDTVTSPRRATLFDYDVFGRMTKLAEPGDALASATHEFSYDLASPLSRIVTRDRSVAGGALDTLGMTCFDGLGRELQKRTLVETGLYQASGFTFFNVQGKARAVFQPFASSNAHCEAAPPPSTLGVLTRFDATGRPLVLTHPDETLYGTASTVRSEYRPLANWAYDEADGDAASEFFDTPTVTFKDGLGRTVRIDRYLEAGAEPLTIRFSYDELGRLASVTDVSGSTRSYRYDLLDRVVEITDPDAGRIVQSYDDAGNLITTTDARGETRRMRYDEANRLLEDWHEGDESGSKVSYLYDRSLTCPEAAPCTHAEGALAQVNYPAGVDSFGYDVRGRATTTTRQLANASFTTAVAYDNLNRVTSRTFPTGQTVTTSFDLAGREIGVPNYVDEVRYNDRGLNERQTFANGVIESLTYDARLRLATRFGVSPSGGLIQGLSYSRDRVGNITDVSDARMSDGGPSAKAHYAYDAWYRLTGAELDAGSSAWHEALSYRYSVNDNIESKVSSLAELSEEHVGDYQYQPTKPHAVTKAGTTYLAYDAAGNVVQRGLDTFQWDFAGRLTRTTQGNRQLTTYQYGADRFRVSKHERGSQSYYLGDDFELRDGIATIYVRIQGQRVAKIESTELAATVLPDLSPTAGDGQITAADALVALQANDDPALIDRLLSAAAKRSLVAATGGLTYLHHDPLGSAVATTDAAGELTSRTEYYPYGTPRYESAGISEDYSFTGQERDRSVGLSYHANRYYDTRITRWVSADPLFLGSPTTAVERPFELNLYSYGSNNPVVNTDPNGLLPHGAMSEQIVHSSPESREAVGRIAAQTAIELAQPSETDLALYGTGLGAAAADGPLPIGDFYLIGAVTKVFGSAAGRAFGKVLNKVDDVAAAATKRFSKEKEALVDMAKADKKAGGISPDDMDAYKELNQGLKDPFPVGEVRGPEKHPPRRAESKPGPGQERHGHVGPVEHIPVKEAP